MDNLENTITEGMKKIISEFENKPITTGIKAVIIVYVLKMLLRFFKK